MPTRRSRPTLKDLATRLGISETAASFALNGRPGVSEQTRERVLALAEELQWAPNHAARTLSGITSMTVGSCSPGTCRSSGWRASISGCCPGPSRCSASAGTACSSR